MLFLQNKGLKKYKSTLNTTVKQHNTHKGNYMELNKISLAIALSTLPMTGVFAAALERSGQSISAFLEPDNYVEAGFNVVDQSLSGKTTNNLTGYE